MKNCGRRFHKEVGKYRFLNELIKVVSPKVSSQFRLKETVLRPHPLLFELSLVSSTWVTVHLKR